MVEMRTQNASAARHRPASRQHVRVGRGQHRAKPASPASELPEREGESFIKWIPIVMPLFAVLLLVSVFLIGTAVL